MENSMKTPEKRRRWKDGSPSSIFYHYSPDASPVSYEFLSQKVTTDETRPTRKRAWQPQHSFVKSPEPVIHPRQLPLPIKEPEGIDKTSDKFQEIYGSLKEKKIVQEECNRRNGEERLKQVEEEEEEEKEDDDNYNRLLDDSSNDLCSQAVDKVVENTTEDADSDANLNRESNLPVRSVREPKPRHNNSITFLLEDGNDDGFVDIDDAALISLCSQSQPNPISQTVSQTTEERCIRKKILSQRIESNSTSRYSKCTPQQIEAKRREAKQRLLEKRRSNSLRLK